MPRKTDPCMLISLPATREGEKEQRVAGRIALLLATLQPPLNSVRIKIRHYTDVQKREGPVMILFLRGLATLVRSFLPQQETVYLFFRLQ